MFTQSTFDEWLRDNKCIVTKEKSKVDASEKAILDFPEAVSLREVNKLRHVLMNLPSIACGFVEVIASDSSRPPELISAYIGQVPINVKPGMLNSTGVKWVPGEGLPSGIGESYPDTTLMFDIDVTYSEEKPFVMSGDMVWVPLRGQEYKFNQAGAPKPEPLYPNITLLQLLPGERFAARCYCILGLPRHHMKWRQVSLANIIHDSSSRVKYVPSAADIDKAYDFGSMLAEAERASTVAGTVVRGRKKIVIQSDRRYQLKLKVETVGISSIDEIFAQAWEVVDRVAEPTFCELK